MGGLLLGLGSLVDFAVVVLESIYRYRENGYGMVEAAKKGASEVGTAVMASASAQIVVFLPIIFVTGIAGILFKPMALVGTFSHIAALFTALTLVPMLSSKLLVNIPTEGDATIYVKKGRTFNPLLLFGKFMHKLNSVYKVDVYKRQELDRANGMIEEFLSLARDKVSQQKLQNLNDIIYSLYPLMAADAYHSKKQIKLLLEDIPKLLLDEKEIRQLLLNLVRNGLEAMESGGIVYIETRMDNGEVILSVSDQGTGIRQDILSKVGIPFFSTKSGGTGMGLAVCYGIAARHNAVIKINTSAKGSIFSVCFKRPNRD